VSDISVAVAMPLVESVKMQTVMSLLQITSQPKQTITVIFVKDSLLHEARRSAVLKAQSIGATHLLFLDSDMVVPGDIVQKLVAHNKYIVGVNSHIKALPSKTTVKFMNEKGDYMEYDGEMPKELFKCYSVGTGVMLVNMKIFKIIEKPWFFYQTDGDNFQGEDIWFCKQAHEKGIDVWCDPTIEIGHVGDYVY
jgi:hypothetical protein